MTRSIDLKKLKVKIKCVNKINKPVQRTRDSHLMDAIENNNVKNVQYILNINKVGPWNSCTLGVSCMLDLTKATTETSSDCYSWNLLNTGYCTWSLSVRLLFYTVTFV